MRNEVFCCTGVCAYVNLDFKRVNVEYARGTLNHYHTIPLLAHVAFIRFLVRVHTLVAFQMTELTKTSSRTHHIRTVSRSCEYACGFVKYQITKTLLAHITFVRFLVRVNTHVVFQSTRFTKTLLAHITLVRFLVRVNTHVSGQIG